MRKLILIQVIITGFLFIAAPLIAQTFIAGYSVAKEEVLRSIPESYINKARTEMVVAYQHSSHGTHVSRGVAGLQDYKSGDEVLFGVSASPDAAKLEFRDYALEDYAPSGIDAKDLTRNETAFIQTTRNYLDAPENATVNVIMWSWCNIADLEPEVNYLPGMASLISEYGPGGSKIGTGSGQREVPVSFIFMTGHANKDDNTGPRNPKEQAALINEYCTTNQQFCLDYYSIDTHAMDDSYYEDAGDDGDSDSYGGNFYHDWQDAHTLGQDYYENKRFPGGDVVFGEHNTQHITANRKAYAFWWILARIAGYEGGGGNPSGISSPGKEDFLIYPNPGSGMFTIEAPLVNVNEIRVMSCIGQVVKIHRPSELNASQIQMDLGGVEPGLYLIRISGDNQKVYTSTLIIQ